MTTVTIATAKTQLSTLIEQVERGEEVVIMRDKKPVARLVPYVQERPKRGSARCGARRGSMRAFGSRCRTRS